MVFNLSVYFFHFQQSGEFFFSLFATNTSTREWLRNSQLSCAFLGSKRRKIKQNFFDYFVNPNCWLQMALHSWKRMKFNFWIETLTKSSKFWWIFLHFPILKSVCFSLEVFPLSSFQGKFKTSVVTRLCAGNNEFKFAAHRILLKCKNKFFLHFMDSSFYNMELW